MDKKRTTLNGWSKEYNPVEVLSVMAYGYIQKELTRDGVLNKDGSPKKFKRKDLTLEDQDSLKLYDFLSSITMKMSDSKMYHLLEYGNQGVNKLIHRDNPIHALLLGVMLTQTLVESMGGSTKVLYWHTCERLITYSSKEHSKEDKLDVLDNTVIAANNLCRWIEGKPQLSKEMRKHRLNKFLQRSK